MSGDTKGHYSCLGLAPGATAAEIKSAYRRLAKTCHPDSGGVADGGETFRRIRAAYEVLIDPARRAAYDRPEPPRGQASRKAAEKLEPIRCSACGQVTAQPRYVVYRQVISFVLATTRTPVHGLYCSACARAKAFKASAISAAAGWWGIPWGPIYTIGAILKNAFGGIWDRSDEERLLWHNALAFSMAGEHRISFGLADRLRHATDDQMAVNAVKLMDFLKTQGVDPAKSKLRDVWSDGYRTFAQLAMLAVVPAITAILIFSDAAGSPASAPSPTATTYTPPSQDIPGGQSAAPTSPQEPAPACAAPPSNGDLLADKGLSDHGHAITIENGSNGDAILKVREAISGRLLASLFIARSQSATMEGIPDGRYRIQYGIGETLDVSCKAFSDTSSASQFPDIEDLTTEETTDDAGTQISHQHLSYTLYPVAGGNVRPESINSADFEQD